VADADVVFEAVYRLAEKVFIYLINSNIWPFEVFLSRLHRSICEWSNFTL